MNKVDYTKVEKVSSFALVVSPLLEPYRIGILLDVLFLILVALYVIIYELIKKRKIDLYCEKYLYLFVVYALSVPVLIGYSKGYFSLITESITSLLLFVFLFGILVVHSKSKYIYKYYRFFVLLTCIVFLIQEILFKVIGYHISGLLPFLDIKYSSETMSGFIINQHYQTRSCSVFLEPSHFAQYLLPFLAFELNINIIKKRFFSKSTVFISLVLIFLRSGVGLIILFLLWVIYILIYKISNTKKIIIIASSMIILALISPSLIKSSIGTELLERSAEFGYNQDVNSSGTKRMFRGFWVFSDLPIIEKIFGITTAGLFTASRNSSVSQMFSMDESYFNNIHTLLIGYGILGTLLFFTLIISLFRKGKMLSKMILISFFVLCFFESCFFTTRMLFYIGLIISTIPDRERKFVCLKI